MSNIAEGFGRGTQGEFITFLGYAIASMNETQSHLCAAYDREYLSREEFASCFRAKKKAKKKVAKKKKTTKKKKTLWYDKPAQRWEGDP